MKLFLCVLACFAVSVNAATLTVNKPHRADTYTGEFFAFSPDESMIGFTSVADDPHLPPFDDRVAASNFDTDWSVWQINLCVDGYCGAVSYVCTLSDVTQESITLDCLDVEC